MKPKLRNGRSPAKPTEEEIREYAHLLYIKSGWLPGRDLDNWLEAEAYLTARARERARAQRMPRRVLAHAEPVGV